MTFMDFSIIMLINIYIYINNNKTILIYFFILNTDLQNVFKYLNNIIYIYIYLSTPLLSS